MAHARSLVFPLLLAGLSLLSAACIAAEAPANDGYAARWPGFVVMVWQYKTPPLGPDAVKLYDSLGLHGIHLDNGFSRQSLQFAADNRIQFYVDHAAGKGDLYIRPEVWRTFIAEYKRTRSRPERPHSLFDPETIARMKGRLDANVGLAKDGPAVGYAFDDEISTTSFTAPVDLDWSPAALTAFRAWLKEQYGTVERLNAEWGTQLPSFDQAEPLPVDDLTSVYGKPFPQWNLSRWADHRSFMDTHFASVLTDLRSYANQLDPRTPAGFVGGQAPAAYGGYDYAKLSRAVEWMEAYDIGGSDEILRSFWGQDKPHVQTFFSTEKPYMDKWFLWHYLAHGDRGVIAWPAQGGDRSWFEGGEAAPNIKALADTFREVQGPLGRLLTRARFQHDRIALYYSQPSIQVSWFMDIQPHKRTWINRSSSMNNNNATDILNRWAWMKLLEDAGVQYNVVSYLDVREKGLDPNEYKVLILPRALALSDADAGAIKAFAQAGGTVIADYLPGVFDEHCKGRQKGALDDLFGVQRDPAAGVLDGKTVAEVNAELSDQPLERRLSYDGAPRWNGLPLYERSLAAAGGSTARGQSGNAAAVITRPAGAGRACYLNISPIEYLMHRGPDGEAYRSLVAGLLDGAGVQPRLKVFSGQEEVPACERLFWERDGRTYLFVVKNPLRMAKVDAAGSAAGVPEGGAIPIRLEFRRPVADLKNERTGQAMGAGARFTDQWVPCEANVYSFKE